MIETKEMTNPIFVEVLGNYLLSAAEEMTSAIIRSAYSPAVRDRKDCSSAILTRRGETVAQASDIPIHLGGLVGIVSNGIERYGVDRIRDGDVLIANDPHQGSSTHLNDITAVAPIFVEGSLVAFACVTAHHSDLGGAYPGSESLDAPTIFHEGLRMPCLLAYRDGQVLPEILDLVVLNSRTPDERAGDLRAQIGAVLKGRERFLELTRKYGYAAVEAGIDFILSSTEARFRSRLRELPDGVFHAVEELDPERATGAQVCIRVAVAKDGDHIRLDFTGTSPQVREGRNVPLAGTVAAVHYTMRALVDPDMPANDGFFRAVEIVAPEGSLVCATSPYPVSSRVSSSQHIATAIFKAVASAWRERVVSGCNGRRKVIFSGPDPRKGQVFVYHETNAGGVGAHSGGDGVDGAMAHLIQIWNMPAEALELTFPLAIGRIELITDSGGAGTWRGGLGVRRDYEVLGDGMTCTLVSEMSHQRMWGLEGGHEGGLGRFVVNPGTERERVIDSSKVPNVHLDAGDVLSVETTGAGGFGDPRKRARERVVADLLDEKISREAAESSYGINESDLPDR